MQQPMQPYPPNFNRQYPPQRPILPPQPQVHAVQHRSKPGRVGLWIGVGVAVIIVLAGLSQLAGGNAASSAPGVQDPQVATEPTGEASVAGAQAAAPQPEPTQPAPAEPEVPAEYKAALRQAQSYLQMMPFSYAGLYDQLTSEYGSKFPPEAAQYAVDNVGADWNEQALRSAISYRELMAMSNDQIWDQLTSEFGGKFTAEQADYAIANLPA